MNGSAINPTTLLTAFFLFVCPCIWAQDLLITKNKDTLNVHVVAQRNDSVFFTFYQGDILRKAILRQSAIKKLKIAYYLPSGKPAIAPKTSYSPPSKRYFSFFISSGPGRLMGQTNPTLSSELRAYVEGLRTGYHLNVSISRKIFYTLGLGVEFSDFHHQNQLEKVRLIDQNGIEYFGTIRDNVHQRFVALRLSGHFPEDFPVRIHFGASWGPHFYRNDALAPVPVNTGPFRGSNRLTIKGNCMILSSDLGLSYHPLPWLGLKAGMRLSKGRISDFTIEKDGIIRSFDTNGLSEDVSRRDYLFGLLFSF